MAAIRITVVIRPKVYKKLLELQAKKIVKRQKNVSFSGNMNEELEKAFKLH